MEELQNNPVSNPLKRKLVTKTEAENAYPSSIKKDRLIGLTETSEDNCSSESKSLSTCGSPDQPTCGSPDQPTCGSPDQPTCGSPDQPTYDSPDQPTYGSPDQPTCGSPDQPICGSPDQPTRSSLDQHTCTSSSHDQPTSLGLPVYSSSYQLAEKTDELVSYVTVTDSGPSADVKLEPVSFCGLLLPDKSVSPYHPASLSCPAKGNINQVSLKTSNSETSPQGKWTNEAKLVAASCQKKKTVFVKIPAAMKAEMIKSQNIKLKIKIQNLKMKDKGDPESVEGSCKSIVKCPMLSGLKDKGFDSVIHKNSHQPNFDNYDKVLVINSPSAYNSADLKICKNTDQSNSSQLNIFKSIAIQNPLKFKNCTTTSNSNISQLDICKSTIIKNPTDIKTCISPSKSKNSNMSIFKSIAIQNPPKLKSYTMTGKSNTSELNVIKICASSTQAKTSSLKVSKTGYNPELKVGQNSNQTLVNVPTATDCSYPVHFKAGESSNKPTSENFTENGKTGKSNSAHAQFSKNNGIPEVLILPNGLPGTHVCSKPVKYSRRPKFEIVSQIKTVPEMLSGSGVCGGVTTSSESRHETSGSKSPRQSTDGKLMTGKINKASSKCKSLKKMFSLLREENGYPMISPKANMFKYVGATEKGTLLLQSFPENSQSFPAIGKVTLKKASTMIPQGCVVNKHLSLSDQSEQSPQRINDQIIDDPPQGFVKTPLCRTWEVFTAQRNKIASLRNELRLVKKAARTKPQFRAEQLRPCDAKIRLYTGFPSFMTFKDFFAHFLEPKVNKLSMNNKARKETWVGKYTKKPGPKRKMSLLDEFLLTMMKLRLNLAEEDLAYRFGIHQTTVSRTISQWLPVLSSFQNLIQMPNKEKFPESIKELTKGVSCARLTINQKELDLLIGKASSSQPHKQQQKVHNKPKLRRAQQQQQGQEKQRKQNKKKDNLAESFQTEQKKKENNHQHGAENVTLSDQLVKKQQMKNENVAASHQLRHKQHKDNFTESLLLNPVSEQPSSADPCLSVSESLL